MKIFITAFCLLILSFNASAQTKIVPIIELKARGLLGGVENGKFIDAETTAAKLNGSENYTLFGLKGPEEGEFAFGKLKAEPFFCEDYYYLETDLVAEDALGVALGDGYRWNPQPRVPKALNSQDATYKKAVADVLRSKGIPKPVVSISQIVRIDLDGDGREEVLITATRYQNGIAALDAKVGDYSFVMVRKIVGKKVQNIVLAGDFIKNKTDYGVPSSYEISSIVDLNGDGKMEIVLYSQYYEGNSAWAAELKGNKPTDIEMLGTGCGA